MPLERLHHAGLVSRERERLTRGRPRDAWVISPEARPGGDPPTGYVELSRWLVRSLAAGSSGVRDVEAVGRQIGRELAPDGPDVAGEQRMHDAHAALGFQPARDSIAGDRLTYRLRNCPYREAVRESQTLVCGLHRGLTRGMLETIDPETDLIGFVAKDPDTAGCLVELRGRMAAQAAGAATHTDVR
jgi:predicted ArsR family transcriptional regulator